MMKKIFTIFAAVLLTASLWAQSPEEMSYQAVIRDASDNFVTSQTVGMQISILQGSISGTAVYVETQTPTTNANGLVSITIGSGIVLSGSFASIDWTNGPYFIKTETAVKVPLTTYTITGTSQLLSVPYALHAKTAEKVTGGITETDPVFTNHLSKNITSADILNWNSAYNWGNHSANGYFSNSGEAAGANRTLGNIDNYALGFKTNNATRLHIANDGNVGIGIVSPSDILTVRKNQNNYTLVSVINETNGANSVAGISMTCASSVGYLGMAPTNYTEFPLLANRLILESFQSGGVNIHAKGIGSDIRFYTLGNSATDEKMRITGDGNIGIGTTTPTTKLDVETNNNNISQIAITNKNAGDESGSSIDLYNDNGGWATFGLLSTGYDGGTSQSKLYSHFANRTQISSNNDPGTGIDIAAYNGGDIRFYTEYGLPENERIRIQANGNVGIGTKIPAVSLDVNGGVKLGDPDTNDDGILDIDGITSVPAGTLRFDISSNKVQAWIPSAWVSLH